VRPILIGMRLYRCLIALALALAATVPAGAATLEPSFFGTLEARNDDLKPFPKWTGMLDRFKGGTVTCDSGTCTSKGWPDFIAGLQGKDVKTQIKEVNRAMNAKKYILDIKNWGQEDYWAIPFEFLKKNGDCEDHTGEGPPPTWEVLGISSAKGDARRARG